MRFGDRHLGPRQVEQPEVHHDGVEAGGVERQGFRVAFAKIDRGITSLRLADHRPGEVETDYLCAARRRGGGDWTRASGDVEQARAGGHLGGIQKRGCRLNRQRAECIVVMRRGALPSGAFELVERARICRHGDDSDYTCGCRCVSLS